MLIISVDGLDEKIAMSEEDAKSFVFKFLGRAASDDLKADVVEAISFMNLKQPVAVAQTPKDFEKDSRNAYDQAMFDGLLNINKMAFDALVEFSTSISDIPASAELKVSLLIAKLRLETAKRQDFFRVLSKVAEKVMPAGSYADLSACPEIVLPYVQEVLDRYLGTLKQLEKGDSCIS